MQVLVADASLRLSTLRSSLRAADEGIAMSAMRIPQLYRRRTNEKSLIALLQHTQEVRRGKRAIEELLAMEDYVGALEVVSATRLIYSEHLTGVVALRAVGRDLEEYSGLICDVMCNKFVNACVSWDVDESVDLNGFAESSKRAVESDEMPGLCHDSLAQLVAALASGRNKASYLSLCSSPATAACM